MKLLHILAVGTALAFSAPVLATTGITFSNPSQVTVTPTCNHKPGISFSGKSFGPLPWSSVYGIFGGANLNCQFMNGSQVIADATLVLTPGGTWTGEITSVSNVTSGYNITIDGSPYKGKLNVPEASMSIGIDKS
jgi:hypothetical protein